MGSIQDSPVYSVPTEARQVFERGILDNPLIKPYLPPNSAQIASKIRFTGTDNPSIPIPWRFAESVSALKAYEALLINALLQQKYGQSEPVEVNISTDHAQLFFMSCLVWTMDPGDGKDGLVTTSNLAGDAKERYGRLFKNCDLHRATASMHRIAATNIYRTKEGRYFHVHGSMNPDPTLTYLGLPLDGDAKTPEESWISLQEAALKYTRDEHQSLADSNRQAGTICHTIDEFRNSEHGKANAHVGLFEIHDHLFAKANPSWWPDSPSLTLKTSAKRPLAGLKVVDLTRVIASPAVSRGLAELGASVMRITSPNITDMSSLHLDLNHGKWNAHLDLKTAEGREKLRALIQDADIVVNGYRPFVYDKYGFSEADILKIGADREAAGGRGIVYARENCYGWNGPWKHRSGWQQISDANTGVSVEYGRAMGLEGNEAVTPVFPNSDYCTGIAGTCGILTALMRRGERGGSYTVDVALNYYSAWLINSVGTYPPEVFKEVHALHDNLTFRHHHNMQYTLPRMIASLQKNCGKVLFNPAHFTTYSPKGLSARDGGAEGKQVKVTIVKPILQFPNGEVELRWNVGTRGNGVDEAKWPEDLSVEVVG